ncbi:MAG: UvrB/UvrC motif-containing protein [Candidatus Poribacteria bacterium]
MDSASIIPTMLPKKAVDSLPSKPGVYYFKDKLEKIIYIGKAKSLRDRVRSYTYHHYKHSNRTRQLVRKTRNVDYTLCGSELEALLLESRLIKENLPEYNILQRRFRHHPFIKITLNEDFPRVFTTWEIEIDGAKYLGPFPRWDRAEEAVEIIHKLFPIRWCDGDVSSRSKKICLKYEVKKCSGPCFGKIKSSEYRKLINNIIMLFIGKKEKIIQNMEREMGKASETQQFEKAIIIRDRIKLIRETIFRSQYQVNAVDNNNLIAIYPSKDSGSAELFFIRKGRLMGQKEISMRNGCEEKALEMMIKDIEQTFFTPIENESKVVTNFDIDAMNIISRWLYRHRNDQSFVHIKKRRSKADAIQKSASDIIKIMENMIHLDKTNTDDEG